MRIANYLIKKKLTFFHKQILKMFLQAWVFHLTQVHARTDDRPSGQQQAGGNAGGSAAR